MMNDLRNEFVTHAGSLGTLADAVLERTQYMERLVGRRLARVAGAHREPARARRLDQGLRRRRDGARGHAADDPRLPRAGVAGGAGRRRAKGRDAHDRARGQGARVPRGLRDRPGGRRLPVAAQRRGRGRARRGAAAGVRRHHARRGAAVSDQRAPPAALRAGCAAVQREPLPRRHPRPHASRGR